MSDVPTRDWFIHVDSVTSLVGNRRYGLEDDELAEQLKRISWDARQFAETVGDFPTDEDVEIAARAWCEANGHFFDSCGWAEQHLRHARAALQAVADARRTEEEM